MLTDRVINDKFTIQDLNDMPELRLRLSGPSTAYLHIRRIRNESLLSLPTDQVALHSSIFGNVPTLWGIHKILFINMTDE